MSGDSKASLKITTNVLVSWGPNISVGIDTEKNSNVLFEFMFRIPCCTDEKSVFLDK